MNLIDRLKLLLNCNNKNFEELEDEEKRRLIKEFRNNLNINNYLDLFNEIEKYLKNNEDNEQIISLLLECINSFGEFRSKVNLLPPLIQSIYLSDDKIHYYEILLEQLPEEFSVPNTFINIVNDYLSYLDNPSNEFYIHNYYANISRFNKKLINYVNKFSNDFEDDFKSIVINLNKKEMPKL